MKFLTLSSRTAKEILRDPVNLGFGLGFPVILLLLLSAIQANVPVSLFEIEKLAPGISVFGMSFMTLFSATLIAKDRGSSLLQRLYTTPLTPTDFILGYTLPILPLSLVQTLVCYICALVLGLEFTLNIFIAVISMIPIAIFFISMGLLCGSIFTDKQVGGICGALLTNLCAWLSGIWFDLELVGGVFAKISYALPFVHAVDMEKAIIAGNFDQILPHLYWVLGYGVVLTAGAIFAFLRQMKRQ